MEFCVTNRLTEDRGTPLPRHTFTAVISPTIGVSEYALPIITVSLSPAIDVTLQADHLRIGEHQKVKLISQSAAGKAINVNRALTAMGIPTKATGFVGISDADFFRQQIMSQKLGGRGIATYRLISLDQPTRQNITILSAEGETHLRMEGFALGELEMRRLSGEVRAVASPGDVVVVAGSVPESILGEDAALWMDFLRQILQMGARIAIDTSGAALRACCREKLLVAKPNLTELGEISDETMAFDPPTIAAKARHILPNTQHRVISCGRNGALWVDDKRALWAHYDAPLRVLRTVGCGDYLLAGFLAGLYAELTPEDSIRRGITTATARAMSLSDAAESLSPMDIRSIEAQVQVESV